MKSSKIVIQTALLLGVAYGTTFAQVPNLFTTEVSINDVNTNLSVKELFIRFSSNYGFVYTNLGLPLIGEHFPFQDKIPDKIAVEKYGSDVSVGSIIIPQYFTENGGFKSCHGVSLQTGKVIWLGFAILLGFLAELSRNLIAGIIGNTPNNLFWYGFAAGFFLGIFIDFNAMFGRNKLVYFDNASNSSYRIVINSDDSFKVGPKQNVGIYLRLGPTKVDILHIQEDTIVWSDNIVAKELPGDDYLVYNIGGLNSYSVQTAAWKK